MKTIIKTLTTTSSTPLPTTTPESTVLIDIETTGFSAAYHKIYLVGFIYLEDNQYIFKQLLAENDADEYQLLFKTAQILGQYQTVIHYNGLHFDMPFLLRRMALFQIPNGLDQLEQLDLYIQLKSIGNYLPIKDLKLKTVEAYFGMKRTDTFSGDDLIDVYKAYQISQSTSLLSQLLLHNAEDLMGLLLITTNGYELIPYINALRAGSIGEHFTVFTNNRYLIIDIDKESSFEMKLQLPEFQVFINKHVLTLTIPILVDTLKLFYSDYENYYYLTLEDYAVHKSIGKLVDIKYRKKAKKSNCYSKKRSGYIPVFDNFNHLDHYQVDYNSKNHYIEITDQFLKETDQLYNYIIHLLKTI